MTDDEETNETANKSLVLGNVEEELPPLKYLPLDIDTQVMRFLILEPHYGNIDSLIKCSFSFQSLSKCEPYTYIINTRGNPRAWLRFLIDGHVLEVTRNIVIFLEHIRSRVGMQRLWFRDVCLNHKDPDEKRSILESRMDGHDDSACGKSYRSKRSDG